MRKLDQADWMVLGSSLLFLFLGIVAVLMADRKAIQPKACECKCFDAGYLQACEDFENVMETMR